MGTIMDRVLLSVCMLLAISCAVYGLAVWGTRSGTSFWLTWMAFAALFVSLGLSFQFHWWALMPKIARNIIITLLAIGLTCFGMIETRIIMAMNAMPSPGLDYVIVLGAQVRASGPSRVLRYRLDAAIDYLEANPNTICVVSGGQGPNEPFPEAEGMADYLEEHGIDGERILEESESTTTEENIRFSRKLINNDLTGNGNANSSGANSETDESTAAKSSDDVSIGLVTNNFHMFRALQIAHAGGLPQAQGIPAGSPPDMLVNNMVREFFAEIKFLLRSALG